MPGGLANHILICCKFPCLSSVKAVVELARTVWQKGKCPLIYPYNSLYFKHISLQMFKANIRPFSLSQVKSKLSWYYCCHALITSSTGFTRLPDEAEIIRGSFREWESSLFFILFLFTLPLYCCIFCNFTFSLLALYLGLGNTVY